MSDEKPEGGSAIAGRLKELTRHAAEIAMGHFENPILVPEQEDELTELTTALELMRQDLLEMESRLRAQILEEQLIAAQRATIEELSTPVLQVWTGILIAPLIGTFDTARAQRLMETLLPAIARRRANTVILDVTGVPVVDTQVANQILKTVRAASLIGATMILTGVSSTNAQTIATLGIDLQGIITRGTLQDGLATAFALHRRTTRNPSEAHANGHPDSNPEG